MFRPTVNDLSESEGCLGLSLIDEHVYYLFQPEFSPDKVKILDKLNPKSAQ